MRRLKRKYLKGGGKLCPYCKSPALVVSELIGGYGKKFRDVSCNKCGQEWQNVYTITDIKCD